MLDAVNADPAVMRHVAPHRPLTRAETADQLHRYVRHWDEHGFGLWAVLPRDGEERAIGFAGVHPLTRRRLRVMELASKERS